MANFARFRDAPDRFHEELLKNSDLWNCNPTILSQMKDLFGPHVGALTIPMPHLKQIPIDISGIEVLRGCPISPVKVKAARRVAP